LIPSSAGRRIANAQFDVVLWLLLSTIGCTGSKHGVAGRTRIIIISGVRTRIDIDIALDFVKKLFY
jgi:hypothetical protein